MICKRCGDEIDQQLTLRTTDRSDYIWVTADGRAGCPTGPMLRDFLPHDPLELPDLLDRLAVEHWLAS